ncbi:MAG: hypothetical protein UU64_C0002G0087 [candidate division WWE3 bacterium GW2011_GWF2_41_45]|uniref:Uncharacterized protein n=3 Tax=Katanobacteria TaxID=422282 RepID=A0A1F4W315_UNCKA|nr:MAG: hypothetical protein UU55_C0001G0031 [candidate division WWE3 bacterium GW2011_GWC2_41_23]KKS10685.1 MAG: hypothetical protein UU64_C0002G0087 [candidate division WWE3 bacterium GW2011_GWF2_41_45]KKS12304.1 MAG: hypothetical protein UU68_C0002G0030 [candidate division WWE3 bacterium GW2011_GWF1_41_53]KKS25846.1 MAG: hypothetical protein UU86_C0049G0002 [candidate division WWE3 bacterium GW2011_GWC1_42_102]KKS30310.1 MAG: hypothetical protein UU90_C0002G0002 [candidate division WWE3 bact
MKNIKIVLVFVFAFVAVFISIYNYLYLREIELRLLSVETSLDVNVPDTVPTDVATEETPVALETFTGTLKKEQIPAELDLGDYWYWLYFDEPYTLEETAAGFPMDIDKIQVNPPSRETEGMDVFDGKHVEIQGNITWGYAESSVIQAEEIVIK